MNNTSILLESNWYAKRLNSSAETCQAATGRSQLPAPASLVQVLEEMDFHPAESQLFL